jgi:hypothetical protein
MRNQLRGKTLYVPKEKINERRKTEITGRDPSIEYMIRPTRPSEGKKEGSASANEPRSRFTYWIDRTAAASTDS